MRKTAYSRKLERLPVVQRPPIVLVACCGQKLEHAAPARDLYTSDLFRKSRAWAEKFGACWFILSAKHGLLWPHAITHPYDETLAGKSKAELEAWGRKVRAQLSQPLTRPIVVLAGAKYRGWLKDVKGIEHAAPLAGMGIGEQKAWLKAQVEGGA